MTRALEPVTYPSGDGTPVAETFAHLYAILVILEVLRQYLEGQQATVLAHQFLYYAPGIPTARVVPDVMVIFGVEPGGRDNYKIWEEGRVPSVVFEITSAATRAQDQGIKKALYEQLGVGEYWLFDPKGEWLAEPLLGYRLTPTLADPDLPQMVYTPIVGGLSAVLGLRLVAEGALVNFYRLDTGEKLLIPSELAAELRSTAARLKQVEQQLGQAEQQLDRKRRRAEILAEALRAQGLDPDKLHGIEALR
ncbi:Uma2 family endonuclease [Gloeobacter morelensis]|uniref:Uma2 family endonuclease n=1 Tax=Gloeobacter morelensis MG652769 TaxID=2781736 RepID=A0ABY3PPQ5_9CYAN|nr:Uma2 family endonuclease [Gloeobacter morelensis]UFP95631.1 Uma2 family endonuclease [Gloeobacter morelensis MG652769]